MAAPLLYPLVRSISTPTAIWRQEPWPPLIVRRHHLRDAGHRRIARIQIALRIHGHVVRFDELSLAAARAVADGAEHAAVPVDLEDLAVLPGREPQLYVRIHKQPAGQVAHLDRPHE